MLSLKLPKKIAVTGGIASGKSTVCRFFASFGAHVVNADEIVHRLLVPTTSIGKEIIMLLGPDIVVDNVLSRERIGQKVFRSPHLLSELEKRIHPEVQKVIEAEYTIASQANAPLFVAEVPLLFEASLESFYDTIIVVVCDRELCEKRYRGGEEDYLLRSRRLMPIEEKIKKSDLVITNHGTLEDLQRTVQITYNSLKENI